MSLTVGGLCDGIGGLQEGLALAGHRCRHAWHAELDPDASKVLAARYPGVPNLRDLTAVDWANVEPVDLLCAGFPCQPVSSAGRRAGLNDERWLFDDIADGIGRMVPRPRWLFFENVPGLLTANGGDAMARVVHRLAALGYLGSWRSVRASAIGAPHRRERIFIAAYDADFAGRSLGIGWGTGVGSALGDGRGPSRNDASSEDPSADSPDANGGRLEGGPQLDRQLLEDPTDRRTRRGHADRRRDPVADTLGGELQRRGGCGLLAGTDGPAQGEARQWERGGDAAEHRRATAADASDVGHERGRGPRRRRDGPTDRDQSPADTDEQGPQGREPASRRDVPARSGPVDWGPYTAAIRRWEHTTGRPAPDPTDERGRLSPIFVEWMMGYPTGWVTDLLGRTAALRCLGNAVVPLQVAAAVRLLLPELCEPVAA